MYIRNLKIKNLRCFEEAELNLQYPGRAEKDAPRLPNINLLLGNNGAGKTTVLKAIALVALSPVMPQSGFVPYHMVRRTKAESSGLKSTGTESSHLEQAQVTAEVLLHMPDPNLRWFDDIASQRMNIKVVRRGDNEVLENNPYYTFANPKAWDQMFDDDSPAFLVVGYGASRRVEDSDRLDESARRKSRILRYVKSGRSLRKPCFPYSSRCMVACL